MRSGETPVLALAVAAAVALALALALAVVLAVALAFLVVIPQGSASSFALAFLAVIPSAARNLLLAREVRPVSYTCLFLPMSRRLQPPEKSPSTRQALAPAPARRPQNLSSPLNHPKPPNPLYPLPINLSKTWHSYPTQLDTLGVEPNFQTLHRQQQPMQLSHLSL